MSLGCALALAAWPAFAQRPLGTDVSSYQGPGIDWPGVKNSGVSFAWAKATEGLTINDEDFVVNESNASAAGVLIGAYHYAHPELHIGASGAADEAAHFWGIAKNYITGGGVHLMPMLDLEQLGGTNYTYSKAYVSDWANDWCNDIVADAAAEGIVVRPVVYTYVSFATEWLNSAVTEWPLWMANYPDNPDPQTGAPEATAPWPSWALWQYSDTNVASGGDSDVFNGSSNEFVAEFVIGDAPLTNLTVALGSNATFQVTASGNGPLNFQWLFNQTNIISGATGSNYTVSEAQLTNAGPYSVVVSEATQTLFTSTAFLSVVAPLRNAPSAVVAPTGMIDWWTADGNTLDIFSGDNGTPAGGFSYAPGEEGLAFHFDGISGYLQLTNPVAGLPTPWTVCCRVNRQDSPQVSATLMGDTSDILKLEQYGANRAVGFTKIGSADWTLSPPYIAPAGKWTHLAFVASGTNTTLYFNGAEAGTVAAAIPLGRTFIGGDSYGDYMLGSLDETMVFNRALTGAEIATIYQAGSASLVRAAQFLPPTLLENGNFGLNFEGLTGKSANLYWTTNFTQWTPLATVNNPNGVNQYSDTNAGGEAFRFYGIQ
jgi:GH25 family lysozyme M1 (1,4-beta-N-acetylmuramidase)